MLIRTEDSGHVKTGDETVCSKSCYIEMENRVYLVLWEFRLSETVISNYWMRLSRIWRILQVEESVMITPSEICRILHILRKPNSIIALLFIQNIFFAQTSKLYSRLLLSLLNDTTLCPGFLGQWFNNLWCQWFNNLQRAALLTSLVQYDRILGQQQLFMVNYACGFNQLERGKYFEWIIMLNTTPEGTHYLIEEESHCSDIEHTVPFKVLGVAYKGRQVSLK